MVGPIKTGEYENLTGHEKKIRFGECPFQNGEAKSPGPSQGDKNPRINHQEAVICST